MTQQQMVDLLWALAHEGENDTEREQLRLYVWNALYHIGLLPRAGLGIGATGAQISAAVADTISAVNAAAATACFVNLDIRGLSANDEEEA